MFPITGNGYILDRSKWFEIKRYVDRFYIKTPTEKIDEINQIRRQDKTRQKNSTSTSGFVYIMKAYNGLFKIGVAVNVGVRLKDINNMSPVKLVLFHWFECKDPYKVERYLHRLYDDYRMHGEWFRLDSDQLAWLKSLDGVRAESLI